MEKECHKCHQFKDILEFNKMARSKDGLKTVCKKCDRCYNEERYALKKEKIISKVREWQNNNPEKVKLIKENYIKHHKNKVEILVKEIEKEKPTTSEHHID
jgi:dTDP-D-glucose 4,6-dehydratase